MSKKCRECRSMINVDAPYCCACGYQFPFARPAPDPPRGRPTWKGRIAAAGCGLLAATIIHALQS